MKLPIKKKYFDMIKEGKKNIEFRDAHITFVCEETGEKIKKSIGSVELIRRDNSFKEYYDEGVLSDDRIIMFCLY